MSFAFAVVNQSVILLRPLGYAFKRILLGDAPCHVHCVQPFKRHFENRVVERRIEDELPKNSREHTEFVFWSAIVFLVEHQVSQSVVVHKLAAERPVDIFGFETKVPDIWMSRV